MKSTQHTGAQLSLSLQVRADMPESGADSSSPRDLLEAAGSFDGEPAPAQQEGGLRSSPPLSRTKALVTAIQCALGEHARVVLTDNRSTLLSQSTARGVLTVRVHQMFLDAPPEVREALGAYLAHGNMKAGAILDAFIEEQDHLLAYAARPLEPDAHLGRVHDLQDILAELNARYFAPAIHAEITWGQAGHARRRSRHTITLGSYDARQRRIVIHPALDQSHVPRLCVARVVHHEMLHAKHGEVLSPTGRRIVHSAAFRKDEALFENAATADAWIAQQLHDLLRFRKVRGQNPRATMRKSADSA